MFVLGKLRRRFLNQIPEDNRQYLDSRRAFTVDGATSMTITTLVSNAYLSGFLQSLGISTVLNGIISAIPTLLSVSQPLGAALAQNIKKRKPFVSTGAFVHRLMFALMFLVPLFIQNPGARIAVATALFISAHFISAFINPAATNWLISLIPQKVRGKYFSIRELYSLVTVSAVTILVGFLLDYFKNSGNQTGGFVSLGVIIAILTIINLLSLSKAMEPESVEQRTQGEGLLKTAKMVFAEKTFRPILIMSIIYNLGVQISIPFQGIYVVGELKISYMMISILTFACSIQKALIIKKWGRYADKTSWANVCKKSLALIAVAHILNFFLVPTNAAWLYPINCLIASSGWAAVGMAMINVQYDYAPLKGRTMYIGICAAATGVIGFSGVFIGSFILKLIEAFRPTLFGHALRGQQILMLLSGAVLICCIAYISAVVQKNKKIINTKEGIAL